MSPEVALGAAQVALALLAIALTPTIYESVRLRRAKVLVRLRPIGSNPYRSRAWRIDLIIKERIYDCAPLLIIPERRGNSFSVFKQVKLERDRKCISVNERGHLEIDLRFAHPRSKIKLRCHLAIPDHLHLYCSDQNVGFSQKFTYDNEAGVYHALMVAQIRIASIALLFFMCAAVSIIRILYLGFATFH